MENVTSHREVCDVRTTIPIQTKKEKNERLQTLKVNTCEPQILYSLKLSFTVHIEIVIFQDKSKLGQFMTTKLQDSTAESSWRNAALVGVRKISFFTRAYERVYSLKGIEGQRKSRKETSTSNTTNKQVPKRIMGGGRRTQQSRTSFNKYERNIKHLSVITSSVNSLNWSLKENKLMRWIRKQESSICCF